MHRLLFRELPKIQQSINDDHFFLSVYIVMDVLPAAAASQQVCLQEPQI